MPKSNALDKCTRAMLYLGVSAFVPTKVAISMSRNWSRNAPGLEFLQFCFFVIVSIILSQELHIEAPRAPNAPHDLPTNYEGRSTTDQKHTDFARVYSFARVQVTFAFRDPEMLYKTFSGDMSISGPKYKKKWMVGYMVGGRLDPEYAR